VPPLQIDYFLYLDDKAEDFADGSYHNCIQPAVKNNGRILTKRPEDRTTVMSQRRIRLYLLSPFSASSTRQQMASERLNSRFC
jgi:hypothetical protein